MIASLYFSIDWGINQILTFLGFSVWDKWFVQISAAIFQFYKIEIFLWFIFHENIGYMYINTNRIQVASLILMTDL